MDKIVIRASMGIVIIYMLVGVFGYLTFADQLSTSLMSKSANGNILECDYKGSRLIQFVRAV